MESHSCATQPNEMKVESTVNKDLHMEISVRYRSETVAKATVCAGKGCYVYFESLNAIADSQGMTKIALPNSKSVNYQTPQKSEKLLEFINRILYNMKHGIVFTYDESDNCVYAMRLCNSMVFMYSPQYQTGPDYPIKLQREHRVKVYDCNVHRMSACSISESNTTKSDPCVYFSVAQKWWPIVLNEDRFSANFLPEKLPLHDCLVSIVLKLHIGLTENVPGDVTQKIRDESPIRKEYDVTVCGYNEPIRAKAASTERLHQFINQLCARVPSMEEKLKHFERKLMQFEASSSHIRNEFHELVKEATDKSTT